MYIYKIILYSSNTKISSLNLFLNMININHRYIIGCSLSICKIDETKPRSLFLILFLLSCLRFSLLFLSSCIILHTYARSSYSIKERRNFVCRIFSNGYNKIPLSLPEDKQFRLIRIHMLEVRLYSPLAVIFHWYSQTSRDNIILFSFFYLSRLVESIDYIINQLWYVIWSYNI